MMTKEAPDALLAKSDPQSLPLGHFFAPDVYLREIFMPAGCFVIGHEHITSHLNIMLTGAARVLMDGKVHEIRAPFIFRSGAGVRKVLFILEDCRWATIHHTNDKDISVIEDKVVDKSAPIELQVEELEELFNGECKQFLDKIKSMEVMDFNSFMKQLEGGSPS